MTSGRKYKHFLHRLFSRSLDFLYPCRCALCDAVLSGNRSLCDPCGNDLPRILSPFCAVCGKEFPNASERSFRCQECSDLSFRFLFARAALVRDPRGLDLIHRFKYNREIHLGPELGKLACEAFTDPRLETALKERWSLIPVPLHISRWKQRQFNQAEEISRIISRAFALPVANILRRTRNTGTQTLLSRRQRLGNLKGAFALSRRAHRWLASKPPGAIIIDDIFTTGATVDECANVIRKAGVREIAVVTVMRG